MILAPTEIFDDTYFDRFSTIDIEQEPAEGEFLAFACDFHDLSSCFVSSFLRGFAPILFSLVIVFALMCNSLA